MMLTLDETRRRSESASSLNGGLKDAKSSYPVEPGVCKQGGTVVKGVHLNLSNRLILSHLRVGEESYPPANRVDDFS